MYLGCECKLLASFSSHTNVLVLCKIPTIWLDREKEKVGQCYRYQFTEDEMNTPVRVPLYSTPVPFSNDSTEVKFHAGFSRIIALF